MQTLAFTEHIKKRNITSQMEENKNIGSKQPGENVPRVEQREIQASSGKMIAADETAISNANQDETPPAGNEEAVILEIKTSDQFQTKENMEVHHHSHAHGPDNHRGKNWKTYFWEFLMLFLAVFCGFLAEYKLEHVIEHQREKEFAKALYAELLDDSTAASNKLARRLEKEKDMDYLSSYFKDSSLTDLPKNVYPAYTICLYLINSYSFEPKDGILSQLRNSGSLRYFKSVALQKLLGDLSVNINNVRTRNEQEYQYFASPIKLFMLKYFDWNWLDELRKQDTASNVLDVINNYRRSNRAIESKILNISSFDRSEASNMILFYKQMLVSTRSLQLNDYMITNRKLLGVLRENYSFDNE